MEEELGPITGLLSEPGACKVYVNGPDQVYIEKSDSFERADLRFAGSADIESLLRGCALAVGRVLHGNEAVCHFRMRRGTTVAAFRVPGAIAPLLCFAKHSHA